MSHITLSAVHAEIQIIQYGKFTTEGNELQLLGFEYSYNYSYTVMHR